MNYPKVFTVLIAVAREPEFYRPITSTLSGQFKLRYAFRRLEPWQQLYIQHIKKYKGVL